MVKNLKLVSNNKQYMCGIFAVFNNKKANDVLLKKGFLQANGRGPESTTYEKNTDLGYTLGFLRLAINGLDANSEQPLNIDGIKLICNGEIYNYKELYIKSGSTPKTNSDCEIIIHLYKKYGIDQTLQLLDGVFAFVLIDGDNVYVARDPYGVRPMFKQTYLSGEFFPEKHIVFASEMKQLTLNVDSTITQVIPGTYMHLQNTVANKGNRYKEWKTMSKQQFSNFSFYTIGIKDPFYQIQTIKHTIRSLLTNAVKKRVLATDRPIACLLSGGLDSSLITSLVCKLAGKQIETYSIGLPNSEDLKYARIVANHLNTKHNEIIVSEDDFFDAIPQVIKIIESYDITTVRASVGNYLVAKYISEHSDAKVIFNGDGSDELTGGYMYFHHSPDSIEFDAECRRLLKNIHFFDVLRSDRSISANGLEARTPFLDREFVDYYLSIPPNIRNHVVQKKCEKYLLRSSFDGDNYLPSEILWRAKEAFSDGVSGMKRSWSDIINEKLDEKDINIFKNYYCNQPTTKEGYYYREIFEKYYPNKGEIIPYFWMPKYVEASDASARKLAIYNEKING